MGSAASVAATLAPNEAAVLKTLREQLSLEGCKPLDLADVNDAKEELLRVRRWLAEANAKVRDLSRGPAGAGAAAAGGASPAPGGQGSALETVKRLEDGTVIVQRADGWRKQTDPDGSSVEVFADGRKLHTHPSGRSQEVFPDGTKITRTEDGKMVVRRADGSKLQKNPDGTTIEVTRDGVTVQYNPQTKIRIVLEPDGTQTQTNENDKSTIQVFPDGTKIDTDATGCKIVKYPDGRRVQRNPNGTVIESWEDGHKIQTKVDGSRIEIFPDGRKVQTLIDGSVIEQMKDGTQVRGLQSNHVCVQCWRCRTIVSVARTAFIVSCRVCHNVLLAHKSLVIGAAPGSTVASTQSKAPAELMDDVRAIFDRFDINRSKSIDRKELGAMLAELQFPAEYFEKEFVAADVNHNSELEWEEFVQFYKVMQQSIMDNAQAPLLAMTNDILQEQRTALEQATKEVEAKHKALEAQMAMGNTTVSEQVASSAIVLQKLKDEYEEKTLQLKQATDAKRLRQKQYLEKKLQDRAQKGGEVNKSASIAQAD